MFPYGNKIMILQAKQKLTSSADIGEMVRARRREQGISQEQLAGVAGTGTRFISDLENGKGTIQVDKMIKVIEALGLRLYAINRWENR